MPMNCSLVMHGSFILVSGNQKVGFGSYFVPIIIFIGPFPKIMACTKGLQGSLEPSSKIFWLKYCSRDSNLFIQSMCFEHSLSVKFCIDLSLPKSTALLHRYSLSIKSGFDS